MSDGELRSLAAQWGWGRRKLEQIEFSLGFFQSRTIDHPAVMRACATLDSYCESVGHSMGKNDLWIAATTVFACATLLTCDRDFDRLVPEYLSRVWIDPDSR